MLKTKMKTRFYNQIKIVEDKIIKISDPDRIQTEYDWYVFIAEHIPQHIPLIHSLTSNSQEAQLTMEYIQADSLYHQYKEGKARLTCRELFQQLKVLREKLSTFHSNALASDIEFMYLHKPLTSLKHLYSMYPHLSKTLYIKEQLYDVSPSLLIKRLFQKFKKRLLSTTFVPIHGDLTLSNIIIDRSDNIYLIDPRGKFGNTSIIGDPRYDLAKLYFSTVGNFDSLNHHEFTLQKLDKNAFDYRLEETMPFTDAQSNFWDVFVDDSDLIEYIHCTNWMSMFPLLQEGEQQTTVAYLHGTYLLNDLFRKVSY